MSSGQLMFDRYVDITLYSADGTVAASLLTPKTGRKPNITLSGSMLPSPIIAQMNCRIVNLATSQIQLSQFSSITVEAGYRNTSGIQNTRIAATINNGSSSIGWAYQESPGPDGVTNIAFMLGDYNTMNSAMGVGAFSSGATFGTVINTICQLFSPGSPTPYVVPVFGEGIANIVMNAPFSFNGLLRDALSEAASRATSAYRQAYPSLQPNQTDIVIQLNGNVLRCYASGNGYVPNGYAKKISVVSSAPKRDTPSSISFVAPWDPSLVTGDVIALDPVFAKQSYGGSLTSGNNTLYSVMTIEFDFSTVGGTNTMRVEALDYVGTTVKVPS